MLVPLRMRQHRIAFVRCRLVFLVEPVYVNNPAVAIPCGFSLPFGRIVLSFYRSTNQAVPFMLGKAIRSVGWTQYLLVRSRK